MAPIFPLEEFKTESPTGSDAAQSGQTAGFTVEDLEQSRLAGYETGFKAGWDDAIRTETDEQARIGVEFARNLQDLGFTFNEARSHVMHALEPLLTSIVTTVLPKLVSETIGQTIVEELLPLASTAADAPIEVVVKPSLRPALEPLLQASSSIPFEVVEEPTLADGQVYLRSGEREKSLDLSGAVERIKTSISNLYDLNERAFKNG